MSHEIEMLPFENPGTGKQFGQVPMASADEVKNAVEEMRHSFEVWRRISIKERVRILRKLQKLIIDSVDLISETINLDTGKSRQDGMIEVFIMVDRLNQYCRHAPRWLRRRRVSPGLYIFKQCSTEPVPFGVVALISPWNYPFDLMMSPMFSALLAGNTVVIKPSEVAGASGVLVEKLVKQVPELSPFVRVVHGDGRAGAALVASKPDFVFLTGSTATGRIVALAAAENMTPYAFELGGKDPLIVLEDADVDAAARWGTWGAFYNTGQTCQAVERVYVVESVYDAFVSKSVDFTKEFQPGYTADKNNPYNLGPLTFERQKHIIEDHMQDALAKGARILVGGQIDSLFMEPTLVVDVDHTMKLMQDETFGPIMPIMKVKDEDEAIRMANDSYFGLSASVWSQDLKRARRVAEQLEVGSVNINDTVAHFAVPLLPFGGRKLSGDARIHGEQEILQFTQYRSYSVGRLPLPFDIATVLRQPGHYRLGVAVMHLAFGVTPKQRVQPIAEEIQRYRGDRRVSRSGSLLAAGLMGAIAAVFFGLWRHRN
jgi:succinate-semialdehyde dehydrogenase/glutarate-semialdehyde dehydrogenase